MMKFYIPNSLNLEDHIDKYDPIKIKHFKKIKLAYIIDIMTSEYDRDLVNGFKNLNAEILKERIDKYNQYLSYLVKTGILLTDNIIIPGEKSRGYKLTDEYKTSVKEVEYSDFAFENNLRKRQSYSIEGPKYLNKWFNDKLKISDEAYEINEEIYTIKSGN